MRLSQPQARGVWTLSLPGPDRKREPTLYCYRMTFRSADPTEAGCAMTWEVSGGRLPYQVALERTATGQYRWHCSCADMVYRGEDNPHHICKHVRGLLEAFPPEMAGQFTSRQ